MTAAPRSGHGLFIAGVGIPGCGKSSVACELAQLLDADLFLEPEEKDWPLALKGDGELGRDDFGRFTGMSWFRSIRVPYYFQAAAARSKRRVAILDSYYDKLCKYLLAKPGMEWLISRGDPYFPAAKVVAELDWALLPPADAIVCFEVDEDTWRRLLNERGRPLDETFGIRDTFLTQRYFGEAAEALATETKTQVVRFEQRFDSAARSAERLAQALVKAELIDPINK